VEKVKLLLGVGCLVASNSVQPLETKDSPYKYSALIADNGNGNTPWLLQVEPNSDSSLKKVPSNLLWWPAGFGRLHGRWSFFLVGRAHIHLLASGTGMVTNMTYTPVKAVVVPIGLAFFDQGGDARLFVLAGSRGITYIDLVKGTEVFVCSLPGFSTSTMQVFDIDLPNNVAYFDANQNFVGVDMLTGKTILSLAVGQPKGVFFDPATTTTYAFFYGSWLVKVDLQNKRAIQIHNYEEDWGGGSFVPGAAFDREKGLAYGAYRDGRDPYKYVFFTLDLRNGGRVLNDVAVNSSIFRERSVLFRMGIMDASHLARAPEGLESAVLARS